MSCVDNSLPLIPTPPLIIAVNIGEAVCCPLPSESPCHAYTATQATAVGNKNLIHYQISKLVSSQANTNTNLMETQTNIKPWHEIENWFVRNLAVTVGSQGAELIFSWLEFPWLTIDIFTVPLRCAVHAYFMDISFSYSGSILRNK